MPTKCHVTNCQKESVARGLCGMHYARQRRHGNVEQTRAKDWGAREKHPAYKAWNGLVRDHRQNMPKAWAEDFWAFVADVPPMPEGRAFKHRPDKNKPWGPDNFFWKEPRFGGNAAANRAEYMRNWYRAAQEHDPDHVKNKYLKRHYGVTVEWYNAQHAAQDGKCAICGQEETAVIHGRRISLAVDHCHDTGRVRGLLCRACNNAIGALGHDPERFRKAIAYLERPD